MDEIRPGKVVIISHTMQAGTVTHDDNSGIWVLLTCGEMWIGPKRDVRLPQDQADLDSTVPTVDRFKGR